MKLLLFTLMLAGGAGFAQPVAKRGGSSSAAPQRWPIASIAVEGNRMYTTAQVLAVAGLKLGQTAGKSDFEAARDRLVACGAFENVSYRFGQSSKGEGIAATLEVAEIEQVYLVDFQDLHVSSLDLDAFLRSKDPIYTRERLPATQPVLQRYTRWIEEYLKSKGIEEKIAGTVSPSPEGGYAIVFRPARPLPKVAQVTFEGNQVISQDKLREAIAGGVGAEYTEDTFRQVLNAAIRPLYEKQGFMRVAFGEMRTEPATDVTNGVHIFVAVREGLSYEMGKVSIEGPSPIAPEALLKAGEFKSGEAANVDRIAEGVERVRKTVRRAGYLDAAVTSERRIDEGKKVVNVALRVDAGPQYTMGKVTFAGLDLEGEAEMKRIWALAEGKPYNPEYPDVFLQRVKERGLFDDLGQTKADSKVNGKTHVVDVTLTFRSAPPPGPGRRGGRGGRGVE
jgi:outer membrane protein insertion porin family